jgi:surfeit locus 1 family protein
VNVSRLCCAIESLAIRTLFQLRYQFRPPLIPTLAALFLIAGMTKLGFWQYDKAEQKMALQATYDARLNEAPVAAPEMVSNVEDWRYRHISSRGRYDPRYQLLLDNQVYQENAGYHVITPFRAEGSQVVMLVDRGWVPMGDREKLPKIETPTGIVEVTGFSWVPSTKFYELSPRHQSADWQLLWQNMDMRHYARSVPFKVLPFVLRLDASSGAGGFVRDWPKPAERVEMHIGYAWQWWGFSAALAAIWLFVNLKRKPE